MPVLSLRVREHIREHEAALTEQFFSTKFCWFLTSGRVYPYYFEQDMQNQHLTTPAQAQAYTDFLLGNSTFDEFVAYRSQFAVGVVECLTEESSHLLWESSSIDHLLYPYRRRFIFPASMLQKIWHTKTTPDNSFITVKSRPDGRFVFDITLMEEIGFVEIEDALITRTVQPLAHRDAKGKMQEGIVSEPTVLVIPKQSESSISKAFPWLPVAHGLGIQFSGEFMPVKLGPAFIEKYNPPTTTALVLVGMKTSLEPARKTSKVGVDVGYASCLR